MRRLALLALCLLACGRSALDEDDVVEKQTVTWPLLGGLQSKTAPLALAPGSYLQLDDVWMQRANEWRARPGHASFPGPGLDVVSSGEAGAAGLIVNAGPVWKTFDPSLPGGGNWTALARFDQSGSTTLQAVTDQDDRSAHSRNALVAHPPAASPARSASYAYGGGFYLVAMEINVGTGADDVVLYMFDAATDQLVASGKAAATLGLIAPIVRPRCAYVNNRLVCFVVDSNSLVQPIIIRTDVSAPAFSLGTPPAAGFVTPAQLNMDALYYSGSAITMVYRSAASTINYREYDPATNTYTTTANVPVNCANALHLMQDPDASGTRFIGYSSTAPATRVIRITSAGALLTDDLAEGVASSQIAGVAYSAGADWEIVYQAGTAVKNAKKKSAVVSVIGSTPNKFIDSGAWRQGGADRMRVVLGVHDADLQSDYFEMGYDFATTSGTYGRQEPQARLLPLEAGLPPLPASAIPHVLPDGTGKYRTALSRIGFVERQGGAGVTNAIAFDQWVFSYPTLSTIPTTNIGGALRLGNKTFIPSGSLLQLDPALGLVSHGSHTKPPQPTLAPSAVGGARLTLLATYQYQLVYVMIDEDGTRWRSQPSVPQTVTLTGGQDTVTVTFNPHLLESNGRLMQIELYRTSGNGTVLRKLNIWSDRVINLRAVALPFTYVDSVTDAVLAQAEDIYTTGELENALTPPLSHVAYWNGRMWGVDRDFRFRVWFTKRKQEGRSFEFVNAFTIDLSDDKGDITGLAALDDKLVVFKRNARYIIQGDGPADSGAGDFPAVVRVDSDIGAIAGSPTVSTGDEVYFVSERGIYRTNSTGAEDFVGAPVDRYLHQPQVQTPYTIRAALFHSGKNEVRFLADGVTAGFMLTYSREFGYWCRWRLADGGPFIVQSMASKAGTPVVFASLFGSPFAMVEDDTLGSDAGSAFTPFIRSPWVRAAGEEGRLRVYEGRVLGERTGGAVGVTPTFSVYYDFDDSTVESYSPASQIAPGALIRAGARFRRTRCTAFSFALALPSNDVTTRLEAWSAVIGIEQGPDAARKTTRW